MRRDVLSVNDVPFDTCAYEKNGGSLLPPFGAVVGDQASSAMASHSLRSRFAIGHLLP
jgi:hypothetical protein